MAARLTDRSIAGIKPTKARAMYFDSEVSGLAVRVFPSGVKSFVFDFRENGRQHRVTIGKFPAWTIGKARIHAGRLRLRADTGQSVAPGRGERVGELIERWRQVVQLTRRPSTAKSYGRLIDAHILPHFGKGEIRAITRNVIEQWHGEIAARTPGEANRAIATLSAFLSWCEHDRLIDRNPAKGVRRRPENQRQIFLNAEEMAAALAALEQDHSRAAALALKLALLTGARIGEVLTLTAEQFDIGRAVWVKPAATTKQRRLHVVPLGDDAVATVQALLSTGLPDYYAVRMLWLRVRETIGRPDIRVHDLRHSRASALARGGASLMQIGRVLGHTAPATTARYAHLVERDLVDLIKRTS